MQVVVLLASLDLIFCRYILKTTNPKSCELRRAMRLVLPDSLSQTLSLCYVDISAPMAIHLYLWQVMPQLLFDRDPKMQTSLLAAQKELEKNVG